MTKPINNFSIPFVPVPRANERINAAIDVIALVGHSSAGKTTIINGLKGFQPDRREEGSDLTGANNLYDFMEQSLAGLNISQADWKQLHDVLVPRDANFHIHDAIDSGIYSFKPGVSEQNKERAIHTATKLRGPLHEHMQEPGPHVDTLVLDRCLSHARKGFSSVFDIIDASKIEAHPLSREVTVKTVLVYCKFHTLSSVLEIRNREAVENGNTENARVGVYPLFQFADLFGPRQPEHSDADVIDSVTRKTVEEDFDKNYDGLCSPQDDLFKIIELEEQRSIQKAQLLTALGFTPEDPPHKTIELVPRRKYGMIVNTNDATLGARPIQRGREAARRILGL